MTSQTAFKKAAIAAVVAFGLAAQAQASSIDFMGQPLNCARLQGNQDPDPNGITCGFVQDVERRFKGAKLRCDTTKPGHSFSAIQQGARHLAVSHGQKALFKHMETKVARRNALTKAKNAGHKKVSKHMVFEQLGRAHPGEVLDFYSTFLAIEGTGRRVQNGASISDAISSVASLFNQKGYRLSGASGSTENSIRALFKNNPVMLAHLQCRSKYSQPTWSHHSR